MSTETDPKPVAPQRTALSPRQKRGWVLVAIGLIVVIWAVLWVANEGYGSTPGRDFAHRRSYDMVKTDVHAVLPYAMLLAFSGLAVLWLGARLVQAPDTDDVS